MYTHVECRRDFDKEQVERKQTAQLVDHKNELY